MPENKRIRPVSVAPPTPPLIVANRPLTVTGPLRRKQNGHRFEAEISRVYTRHQLKLSLTGP
jgi:hypothetical protein